MNNTYHEKCNKILLLKCNLISKLSLYTPPLRLLICLLTQLSRYIIHNERVMEKRVVCFHGAHSEILKAAADPMREGKRRIRCKVENQ